jgi:hypothetical protein
MYLGNKLTNWIFWKRVAVSVLFAYKWRLFNNFIFYDFFMRLWLCHDSSEY